MPPDVCFLYTKYTILIVFLKLSAIIKIFIALCNLDPYFAYLRYLYYTTAMFDQRNLAN